MIDDEEVLLIGEEDVEDLQVLTPEQLAHKEAQAANAIESRETPPLPYEG